MDMWLCREWPESEDIVPLKSPRLQSEESVTKDLRILSGLAALIFAIAIPLLYFSLSVYSLQKTLKIETFCLVKNIERIIQKRPKMWEFEYERLLELISKPVIDEHLDERTIRSAAGAVVAKTDFAATRPAIAVSVVFFDSGKPGGLIETRRSIRKQLFVTVFLGMLSSTLGYILFSIFRTYPIRKLENTLADLRRAEEELREMSLRDQMTELYNRRGFITLAERQIRLADRARKPALLIYIDYDGLKSINDTFGHEEGDNALIDTANILRETFREADIIARLGGDEFAVIVIEITSMNPDVFLKRLQENIDANNAEETRPYKLAMSWGMAIYNPGSPMSLNDLISLADERMYAQKKAKSNRRI